METKTYTFVHVAPIPVGHKVELNFIVQKAGVFRKEGKISESEAILKDLDTGIIYALASYFRKSFTISGAAYDPEEIPMEPLPDLVIGKTVKGKVIACNLYTLMAGNTWRIQTQITVEAE